jgi:hypothetical protein
VTLMSLAAALRRRRSNKPAKLAAAVEEKTRLPRWPWRQPAEGEAMTKPLRYAAAGSQDPDCPPESCA